jgi:PAS domain S-box-containing protein
MVQILVVDDEQDALDLITSMLIKEGFKTATALTGEEALRVLEKKPVDLILLDLMMPDMSGFEVCEKMEKNPKLSSIPVVVVTAKGDFESIETAYKCSIVKNYIAKPFEKENLLKIIKEVLKTEKTQKPRKKLTKSLKEGLYKEIIESYPEAIVILDDENAVLNVNNAFEAMTGFKKEEVISSRNLPELLKPQDDEGNVILFSEAFRACYCDDPMSTAVFNIINRSGVKLRVVSTVFKTKSKVTVIVLRNITTNG